MPTAQSNDTQKQLIEKLLRGQRHAGSGVWHQGGVASKRTKEQTDEITNAIAISSRFNIAAIKNVAPTLIKEEDKDDAEDDSEAELERKRREENEREKKQGGFFAGLGGLLKTIAMGKDGKGEAGFFKGGLLGFGKGAFKGIGKLFTILGWVLKWIGGPLLAIGALAFLTMDEGQQKKAIESITKGAKAVFEYVKYLGEAFKFGFMGNLEGDDGIKANFEKFKVAWGKAFKSLETMTFGPFAGSMGPYTGLAGIAEFVGDIFGTIVNFMIKVGTGIGNFIADPKKATAGMIASVEAVFEKMGIVTSAFFSNLFSLESFSGLIKHIIGDTMYDILMKKGGFFADKMKEVHQRAQKLRKAQIDTLKRKEQFTKEEADRLENEIAMKKKNGESVTMAEELELARAREQVNLYKMQRENIETEVSEARKIQKQEFIRQQIRDEAKKHGVQVDSEGKVVGVRESKRQKDVMETLLSGAKNIPEERILELVETGMNEKLAEEIANRERSRGSLHDVGALKGFSKFQELMEAGDVEGFRKLLGQLAVTGGDIATKKDKGFLDTGLFATEEVMDKKSHKSFIATLRLLGYSAEDIGEQRGEVDISLVKKIQAAASNAMFTMNVLHKDQADLISDQKAYLNVVKDIEDQAGKDFEEKYPKLAQGGLVNYTGLAMVHGGDGRPEVMFDNIQMNRLEALLTYGERNAGEEAGAVVYNMGGNVTDQSKKSVFMFPERHLFGERLQLGRV